MSLPEAGQEVGPAPCGPRTGDQEAAGEGEDCLYIAMRYVEGRDLERTLEQDGPLRSAQAGRPPTSGSG